MHLWDDEVCECVDFDRSLRKKCMGSSVVWVDCYCMQVLQM